MISTVEVKTDDLDGTVSHQATKTPVETVEFSLDGERYAIDLTARNAKAFRAIFAQYIPHAQRAAVQPSLNGHPNGHKRVRRDRAERGK
jgi:Lsr2